MARMTGMAIRRALLSVSDKTGIVELGKRLAAAGIEIVSSGGTFRALQDAGVVATRVSDVTAFPEVLGGRVKTLHPHIHAGILADRRNDEHVRELEKLGIPGIDLVVCNLYPFEKTVAAGVSEDDAIEQIDVGGPAMVRAAAKNWHSVVVVVDPADYEIVGTVVEAGELPSDERRRLARKAFAHTAAYDASIATYFTPVNDFPESLLVAGQKVMDLRYGENPHQAAAFYRRRDGGEGLADARQLHGKELSYNNLLDADAAWRLVGELRRPAAVIVKHSNPCGAAIAASLADAHAVALECDRTSAFGGIVALNDVCDEATARSIAPVFTEVVIAPGYAAVALEVLCEKKNLRVLEARPAQPSALEVRTVAGGLLVQTPDSEHPAGVEQDEKVVTKAQPSDEQWADLRFAWTVAKHVKSNAIVLARDGAAVGVGAGQMSRVEATELAARRAGERARATVCASDAFFPFRDGLDAAVAAGAVAVIQPGGSVRDDEVIAAADEHGIPMVFTGRRHFRH